LSVSVEAGSLLVIIIEGRRERRGGRSLFVDPVSLVDRINEHFVGDGLARVEVGHVDVQLALDIVIGDAAGIDELQRYGGVPHEGRATRHVRVQIGIWMRAFDQLRMSFLEDACDKW
jgi:hypothetical protein